uniref:Killer toxin Kp4 domain-containing protein n=1 Tax=Physcomitrium patens TaxID=3218 RepID=A0A2K1IJQ9_PHYPA|nr:hypothetical protein PHYPA_028207 [Physcomitrium patens]
MDRSAKMDRFNAALVIFLAAALVMSASTASELGINCRGSFICSEGRGNEASILVSYINNIDPNRWYQNGQHIACYDGFCAFLQNTGGAWGYNTRGLAHFIPEHGCRVCGSVPYFYPSINDVSKGQLTFNYVSKPKCRRGLS